MAAKTITMFIEFNPHSFMVWKIAKKRVYISTFAATIYPSQYVYSINGIARVHSLKMPRSMWWWQLKQ